MTARHALFAIAVLLAPAPAGASLIFDNIAANGGRNYASTESPPSMIDSGFGFDAGAADDFKLPGSPDATGDWLVTGVGWSGLFTLAAPVPLDRFRIIFWPSGAGGTPDGGSTPGSPPDYGRALAIYEDVPVIATPGGGGAHTFDYSATLPQPFYAEDSTTYWLEVQPRFNYPPLWRWQVTHLRQLSAPAHGWDLLALPFWSTIADPGDLAFTLSGDPVPEPATVVLAAAALLPLCRRRGVGTAPSRARRPR